MSQYLYVHDCTASPVSTTAYTEVIESSTDDCSYVQFFYFKTDTSFGLASLALGSEGNEIDYITCSQKIGTPINLYAINGSRFSIKAIGSDITTGYIIICLLS